MSTSSANAAHYRKLLARSPVPGLESTVGEDAGGEADLSDAAIGDRVQLATRDLHRVVDEYLDGDPDLHALAEQFADRGKRALSRLAEGDDASLDARPEELAGLEVIVRSDGSRPSFLVRNDEVDLQSSAAGRWEASIFTSSDSLRLALACIGRIDSPLSPQGFQGTGFLLAPDLLMTNRHVLQEIAEQDERGRWQLQPDASVDFGHEFRAQQSRFPRQFKSVLFSGAQAIDPAALDHRKLDLAIIELEPVARLQRQASFLGLETATDWADPARRVYVVGYPGEPGPGYTATLLEMLFKSTFGRKRLAPGQLMRSRDGVADWTCTYDVTTLGGNSGSAVLLAGREGFAAGLHYGGKGSDPRENWGHVLGMALDSNDGHSAQTLGELLQARGVQLVDGMA